MSYVFDILNESITRCGYWFIQLLDETGMTSYYLAMLFISLVGRFILSPIFGFAVVSSGSDAVKRIREQSRNKGHFEKNQRGKYTK